MRARKNIALKERREITLREFRGVDFSSAPTDISAARASNMRNLINENGQNRKRSGWREIYAFKGGRINGIFEYKRGEDKMLVVHSGRSFYEIRTYENGSVTTRALGDSSYLPARITANKIKDQRSQAFLNKGKMYITGCGDFLVYGTWDGGESFELRRVMNNEDTYIPTTTVSIDCDGKDDTARASLDEVNLLSSKRINKLLGAAATHLESIYEGYEALGLVSTEGLSWTLDAEIEYGSSLSEVNIRLDTFAISKNEAGEDIRTPASYTISNNPNGVSGGFLFYALYVIAKDGEALASPLHCGTIKPDRSGIELYIQAEPQIEGEDNIFVSFEHENTEYENRICECNFGILFGADGSTDRLFLSGNKRLPNMDFYSEAEDFTYFADRSYATLGSDFSAILGYGRLSDSSLIIYKEEMPGDATVYYRSGTYRTDYDKDGGINRITAIFSHRAGGIGESVISRFACANFVGDNLILSKNGVFGIVLSDNVATSERYVRERSRSVNGRLTRHDNLSDAVGIVFGGRYYLSVDDVCYVADSRYKYSTEDTGSGAYNYEWWYWDNIPARVFAVIDGELAFGREDGKICVFDGEYSDRSTVNIGAGSSVLNIPENKIVYEDGIVLKENDRIKIRDDNVFALVAEELAVDEGRIFTDKATFDNLRNGMAVYAYGTEGTDLLTRTVYKIAEMDAADYSFALTKDGRNVSPAGGGFSLYAPLTNTELYITDVENGAFGLKMFEYASRLNIERYGEETPTLSDVIVTHRENVVSEWHTPLFDFGTNEKSKTLLKMTVSVGADARGSLSFGYETRRSSKLVLSKKENVFSLDDFSFENFTLETAFAHSYSVKCNDRNFNFIIFKFISDSDTDCTLNTFTAIYKLNKSNKGKN